ncbi:hypothetical protein Htur_1363 [Haloterrigena turkmenica DSM 5511]|uniref:Uncharacterized protein n=1 Tax=Haloterrigena turkmenica (strain ATCC 51198 / DSM 5511 / JCM 9101 / NCIMB 13204 / VKM B-1734 / 4k) TaxID=543526 RepID=D2RPZ2_HALTV|nr:hypothetical protein [Haloterrigena turkmenica]ADB60251.1 hypothetical protein Htur_1363 [Haloterrigena turkmenica DSM 5511]
MSEWIARNIALSFVFWAIVAFVLIGGLEVLVFDRFEPLEYVGSTIGLGIGFTVGMPPVPLRTADT